MRTLTGVVVRAHKCAKTIRVRVAKQVWNKRVRKNFTVPEYHLAHDGAEACIPGDIVRIVSGLRTSRNKRAIVSEIVSPFGTGSGEPRKPIETIEEWAQAKIEKRVERGKIFPPVMKAALEYAEGVESGSGVKPLGVEERWWRKGFGLQKKSANLGITTVQGVQVDVKNILEKLDNKEIVYKSRKQAKTAPAATATATA